MFACLVGRVVISRQVDRGQAGRALDAVRRSFQEFLRIPVVIIGVFLALAVGTYLLDNASIGVLRPLRRFMVRHVFADPQATSELLGAIAGSLITVASITFSLLLLAIQQSAGSR